MSKYNLPLKDLNIQDYADRRSLTLYQKNRLRLGFLPKVFMGVVVLFFSFSLLVYFNTFGIQDFFRNAANDNYRTKSAQEIVKQNSKVSVASQTTETNSENAQKTSTSDGKKLFITNNANENCTLVFSKNKPEEIKSLISSAQEGWWKVSECTNKNLEAIQVVRVADESLVGGIKQAYKADQTSPFTYIIPYTKSSQVVDYPWSRYAAAITSAVWQDRVYFDPVTSYETKMIENKYYYTSKGCHSSNSGNCSLWVFDKTNGQLEKLYDNLLDGYPTTGVSLKFAKTQDYSLGVNLVVYTNASTGLDLLRFNAEKMEISKKESIKDSDKRFELYYR